MVEADSTLQVAWNGIKGLGSSLMLTISFVTTSVSVWSSLAGPLDIFPTWVLGLALIGITSFMVFLIFRILKGEPQSM